SAATLADEADIAQLAKRPTVNKTSRFTDLPDAMPNLLPPQRSLSVSGEQDFRVLLSVVNRHSRARFARLGVVPNVPAAHGWLTGAGDCIHLFWRSDLHQCRRAAGAASSGLYGRSGGLRTNV